MLAKIDERVFAEATSFFDYILQLDGLESNHNMFLVAGVDYEDV
jgi:hypothetical protein